MQALRSQRVCLPTGMSVIHSLHVGQPKLSPQRLGPSRRTMAGIPKASSGNICCNAL